MQQMTSLFVNICEIKTLLDPHNPSCWNPIKDCQT